MWIIIIFDLFWIFLTRKGLWDNPFTLLFVVFQDFFCHAEPASVFCSWKGFITSKPTLFFYNLICKLFSCTAPLYFRFFWSEVLVEFDRFWCQGQDRTALSAQPSRICSFHSSEMNHPVICPCPLLLQTGSQENSRRLVLICFLLI